MQHNINSLIGYSMEATDGDIGEVKEFYFDDKNWAIRYLILQTGNWLYGRKVLISPQALTRISGIIKKLPVNLSKEKIRNSPDIDTNKPISRQQEIELYGHYAWQRYGGDEFYAGASTGFITPIIDKDKTTAYDEHLRSTSIISGYHVHAIDGDIGHINDFIIDDETWQIISVVVDTHNWFGGKKVLIPVENIKEIQWGNSKVITDCTISSIKGSAVFDKKKLIEQQINSTTKTIFNYPNPKS